MQEVRRLREDRGWGQKELAFHADLSQSVISEIETGKRSPSARTLRKMASALEVEVADLFPKVQARLPLEPSLDEAFPSRGDLRPEMQSVRRVDPEQRSELRPEIMIAVDGDRRREALRAATAEERERYVSQIDVHLKHAEQDLTNTDPADHLKLLRYAHKLGIMRGEAEEHARVIAMRDSRTA